MGRVHRVLCIVHGEDVFRRVLSDKIDRFLYKFSTISAGILHIAQFLTNYVNVIANGMVMCDRLLYFSITVHNR